MRLRLLIIILFLGAVMPLSAQVIGDLLEDETVLKAEVKQVNQFFRRFNSEEDVEGERLYEGQKGYHDNNLRKMAIPMLFDRETSYFNKITQEDFINKVTDKKNPVYLNFHGGEWFAEVVVYMLYYGRSAEAHLFLKIQEEPVGSKWVISSVYFEPFNALFFKDPKGVDKFLHPMSHELDFMNLYKVFQNNTMVEYYAYDNYLPDYLSIFIYEMKMGHLKFESVKKVKFHFFQVDGYYFQLEEFNRPSFNNGWLITRLEKINPEQKENLLKSIYHEAD